MWPYLLLYYCMSVGLRVSTEVITLLSNETIICVVSESSLYSALDIVPPLELNDQIQQVQREIDEIKIWSNSDDWKYTSKSLVAFDVVTDRRWEDSVRQRSGVKLKYNKQSFWVCSSGDFNFTVSAFYHSPNKTVPVNLNQSNQTYCEWFRWVVTKNDQNITLQYKEKNFSISTNFEPVWLGVENSVSAFHSTIIQAPKYNYFYSEERSSNENYVELKRSDCILMYVSIDKGCSLNIGLKTDDAVFYNQTIDGFNDVNDIKKWERINITTNHTGKGKLYFLRGKKTGSKGFWAIDDIQYCKNKYFEMYKKNVSHNSTLHVCRDLNPLNQNPAGDFSQQKVGCLSKDCNITCEEVLGDDYSFCQGYKICPQIGKCFCAWGFQGTFCNETCNGYKNYGLDCKTPCPIGCSICEPIGGCRECKKKFFGSECSEEFPVLRNPPVITSITKNATEICFNMDYNENEAKPEFYLIQYKKSEEEKFQNYTSTPCTYSPGIIFANLSFEESIYKIRTILIVNNQHYEENVPELVVHKSTLKAIYQTEDKTLQLSWDDLDINATNYKLKYECQNKFISGEHVTDKTNSVVLLPNKAKMLFHDCKEFKGPLNISLIYRCISNWCSDNKTKTQTIWLERGSNSQEINLSQLKPFTDYELNFNISASNANYTYTRKITMTTPPAKPTALEEFSVYSRNDTMLWLRWKEPYPPLGTIELYNITYMSDQEIHHYNITAPCKLWDNYTCSILMKLKNQTIYNVTIQAKNRDVADWSEPTRLKTQTTQSAPEAPGNLTIETSHPDKISLTWRHPFYENGPLKKFCISVEKNVTCTLKIEKYQRIYNYWVTVEPGKEYTISIWGENLHVGKKAVINVTILYPVTEISPNLPVEWCSQKCFLLVPIQNENMVPEVEVTERNNNNPSRWIAKYTRSGSNILMLEIGEGLDTVVSVKNQTYDIALVLNGTKYKLEYRRRNEPPTNHSNPGLIYIVFPFLIVLGLIVLAGFLIYTLVNRFVAVKDLNKCFQAL